MYKQIKPLRVVENTIRGIATEENVISFVKIICMIADGIKQISGKMNFDSAMRMLNHHFSDSIGEELMTKVSKALEEHGIIR